MWNVDELYLHTAQQLFVDNSPPILNLHHKNLIGNASDLFVLFTMVSWAYTQHQTPYFAAFLLISALVFWLYVWFDPQRWRPLYNSEKGWLSSGWHLIWYGKLFAHRRSQAHHPSSLWAQATWTYSCSYKSLWPQEAFCYTHHRSVNESTQKSSIFCCTLAANTDRPLIFRKCRIV